MMHGTMNVKSFLQFNVRGLQDSPRLKNSLTDEVWLILALLPFRRLWKLAKSYYYRCIVCLSCRSLSTTRLPLDGLSWYFMFEYFSKIYRQNYLKSENNSGHFTWSSTYIYDNILLNFSRMRNVSDKICIQNQNTLFIFNNFFYRLWENVEKTWYSQKCHTLQYI
jgi:hypothetical protein